MTEEVNYYEILRGLENLLYKIQCYKPANDHAEGWIATRANELRLEVLQYIFSVSILKNEFIKKVNEYVKKRETPNFKKDVEQFKIKILELYYNDNSENPKIDDIDDFLFECRPDIFYYPKVTTTRCNYQLCDDVRMLYANFNPVLLDCLKVNTPLEYYIITYNYPLYAENFRTLFSESYKMSALWNVVNSLYSFIDKQCRGIYTGQTMKFDSIDSKLQKVTPTQRNVCKEIMKGNSVNNIAITLKCTQSTIREHIRQACLRLSIDGKPGITNLKKYLSLL